MNPILAKYIPIADLIVRTFGNDVEVVLHDLSTPIHSVVYVANNSVTGRRLGESFQHLVQKSLHAPESANGIVANYYFHKDGKLIRSSSLLIRDEQGQLTGALCINIDTTRITQQIESLTTFLPGIEKGVLPQTVEQAAEPRENTETENHSVTAMVNEIIDHIISEVPDKRPYSREKLLALIRFMDSRDIFLVKGAIDRVAEKLQISKVTVYSDLDEIRGKR